MRSTKILISNFAFNVSESLINFEHLKRAALYFDKIFLDDHTIKYWSYSNGCFSYEFMPKDSPALAAIFDYFNQIKLLMDEGVVEKFNLTCVPAQLQSKLNNFTSNDFNIERFKLAYYCMAAFDNDATLTLVRREDQEALIRLAQEMLHEVPVIKKWLMRTVTKSDKIAFKSLYLESLPNFELKTFYDVLEVRAKLREKGYLEGYSKEMNNLAKEMRNKVWSGKFYQKLEKKIIPRINTSIKELREAIKKDYWFKKMKSFSSKSLDSIGFMVNFWPNLSLWQVIALSLCGATALEKVFPADVNKHEDSPYNFLLEISR